MRFRHVAIVVKNMDKEKKFYIDIIGLIPVYDRVEKVRIVKLHDKNNSIIELLEYESQSETNLRRHGISHIAFTEDKEENLLEIVTEEEKVNVA